MKRAKRILTRAAVLMLSLLCILPLCSCFDRNYSWDIPERSEADINWGEILGILSPNQNPGVGKQGMRLALSDDGGHYIIEDGKNCKGMSITLPSSYCGIPITEIASGAFSGMNMLKSVTIPDCITKVASDAFDGCDKLEFKTYGNAKYLGNTTNPYAVLMGGVEPNVASVTIHPKTRVIADRAFKDNTALTELSIPENVEYIGYSAFSGCKALSSVIFEGGGCSLADYAFSKCASLSKVDMGNFVTEIGASAFYYCQSLGNIKIPDSVKSMGEYAFAACDDLKTVKIGRGVTCIDEYTFYDCKSLTSVELSRSVTKIGKVAFRGCSSLSDIALPESIEVIGEHAFEGTNITFRVVNYWAQYLGTEENPYAFLISAAPNLISNPASILLHKDTKVIACGAFPDNLHKDSTVEIDGGEGTYLRSRDNCIIDIESGILVAGVVECVIPDDGSVKAIGDYAFYGNQYLKSLFSLPASVLSVGNYAFYGCDSLVSVNLAPGVETIGDYAFAACTLLSEVGFSNRNLKSIGSNAFYGCVGLGKIVLPESLTYLGDYAFYNCRKLKSVSFGSNIGEIRKGTFENCSQLTSVTHGGSIRSIGSDAFRGCKKLAKFKFSEGLEYIGNSAFISCEKLSELDLPDSLREIGSFGFGYCYALDKVSLGNGIVRIGENAFTSIECNIEFRGNIKEWESIDLGNYYSNKAIKVICRDGDSEIPTVTTEPYN